MLQSETKEEGNKAGSTARGCSRSWSSGQGVRTNPQKLGRCQQCCEPSGSGSELIAAVSRHARGGGEKEARERAGRERGGNKTSNKEAGRQEKEKHNDREERENREEEKKGDKTIGGDQRKRDNEKGAPDEQTETSKKGRRGA